MQARSSPIGTYYYLCGPVPPTFTGHATSTQHLIIGDSALFYSAIFDVGEKLFEFATPLSTTGKFPKQPKSIKSIAYTTSNVRYLLIVRMGLYTYGGAESLGLSIHFQCSTLNR